MIWSIMPIRRMGTLLDSGERGESGEIADSAGKDVITAGEMQILKRLGFNMQVCITLHYSIV